MTRKKDMMDKPKLYKLIMARASGIIRKCAMKAWLLYRDGIIARVTMIRILTSMYKRLETS